MPACRIGVLSALALSFVSGLVAPALADARFDRVKAAFAQWADSNKIGNASLVLVANGEIVGRYDRGSYSTATPEPVASDSKFITGLCVVRTVEAGLLKFSTTLGDVLPKVAASAADPQAKSITVADLLTHTSGIDYDPSQGGDLKQFKPFTKRSELRQVQVALQRPLGHPPGQDFFYNNENFAALGAIIEAVTHEDYVSYCSRTVLAPAGITDASFNPPWMVMGTYGAWLISAEDYAKLMTAYLSPASSLLKIGVDQWPTFARSGGVLYGIGVNMRKNGDWYNFWHFGSWHTRNNGADVSFGAYYADWGGTLAVFADYTPTIEGKQADALDSAMLKAATQ